MATEIEQFESPSLNPLDFYFWGWTKGQVYRRKTDTQDELLARIFDAAARIKQREDQLRRTRRELRTRVAKFTDVDGGIFEHLL